MKLWTTVHITELPRIHAEGFTNPYGEEITFDSDPQNLAEVVLEQEDEGAVFLEIEIPDDEIEVHFAYCTGIHYDHASDEMEQIRGEIESGEITEQAELEEAVALIDRLENMDHAADALDYFGFVCLGTGETIPREMIKLLDPETMMDAVWTGDMGVVAEAIETTEAKGLETLNASFWVWIMFLFQNMFAIARGEIDVEPTWKRDAAEDPVIVT